MPKWLNLQTNVEQEMHCLSMKAYKAVISRQNRNPLKSQQMALQIVLRNLVVL